MTKIRLSVILIKMDRITNSEKLKEIIWNSACPYKLWNRKKNLKNIISIK